MLEVPTYTEKVPWRPTIAKVLVVLLYPFTAGYFFGSFYWLSILVTIGASLYTLLDSVLMILVSILLLLPGIFLERRIKSRPIANRVRRSVLATIITVWSIPFIAMLFVPSPPEMLFLYIPLTGLPILSISFFIILPLLNREFIIRQTPEKYHSLSYIELSRTFKQSFGRRRFLPLLIWFGLLFSPLFSFGTWETSIESLLYSFVLSPGGLIYADGFSINQIIYSIPMTYMMHGTFLIFSLRFVFIRDLFRFNQRKVTHSRLISMGILSEIAPAAMLTLQQLSYIMVMELPFGYYNWILPTPIFPLLGYLFVRMSRALPPYHTLWDEEEHRIWFEEKHREKVRDPRLKVPISYLIRSRLRKLRK